MASVKPSPRFKEWLTDAVPQSGLSKREIGRRMAATHPKGVTTDTIDTHRRTINKILAGELTPTQPTRDLIAAALERHDAPSVEDEEEDDLEAALMKLARRPALVKQLIRALEMTA